MTSGYFFHDTVHVLRPGTTTNRAGETVPDRTALEDVPGYPRALVQVRPTSVTERTGDDRDVAAQEWLIATAPGSGDWDVNEGDWIRLPDGTITAVAGPPLRPTAPESGRLDHVQVRVRRAVAA